MKLRIFYRKSDLKIVWVHTTDGDFPQPVEDEINGLPNIYPDRTVDSPGIPIGGVPGDYGCLEITDPETITAFLASDDNYLMEAP